VWSVRRDRTAARTYPFSAGTLALRAGAVARLPRSFREFWEHYVEDKYLVGGATD
jgi:hypothetical protein